MLHYNASSNKRFLLFSVKLIKKFFSAVSVVPSNPCVGPLTRIKPRIFSCYQHLQENSYLLEKLYNFYQSHYLLRALLFYQIQYHIQNIYTYQSHYFWSNYLPQINNFLVLDNCLYQNFYKQWIYLVFFNEYM